MAGKQHRMQLRLDDETHALLEAAGDRSEYIRQVVRQHAQRWREAHDHLSVAGWRTAELSAACDALSGFLSLGAYRTVLGARLAAELADYARLGGLDRWEVSRETWTSCIETLAIECTARALTDFAAEFWIGSDAVAQALVG